MLYLVFEFLVQLVLYLVDSTTVLKYLAHNSK